MGEWVMEKAGGGEWVMEKAGGGWVGEKAGDG